jgi:AraC-like DNA-binding protein
MPIDDSVVRGGTEMLLLFQAALLLRDGFRVPAAWYAGLLVLSALCAPILNAPDPPGQYWDIPFAIGAVVRPALLWMFADAAFDDEFEFSRRHLAAWLSLVTIALVDITLQGTGIAPFDSIPEQILEGALTIVSLACAGLAIRRALSGRAKDLVEGRRRLRVLFILLFGLNIVVTFVIEAGLDLLGFGVDSHPATLKSINAGIQPIIFFGLGLALLGASRNGPLLAIAPLPRTRPLAVNTQPSGLPPSDDQETEAVAALRNLMERQRAYREEGLTVATLAAKLATPEYRLRRLINQRLGHRNFNEFLNGYRLAEVTQALADPAQADVPILTIALDAGFGSLSPFNRAFKAHAGQTPTEFRRDRLGRPAQVLVDS